jgi:hypothetical protein
MMWDMKKEFRIAQPLSFHKAGAAFEIIFEAGLLVGDESLSSGRVQTRPADLRFDTSALHGDIDSALIMLVPFRWFRPSEGALLRRKGLGDMLSRALATKIALRTFCIATHVAQENRLRKVSSKPIRIGSFLRAPPN